MTILIDNSKAVEISIREWDEENTQYGPDWSADFFEVGGLKTVDDHEEAHIVDDVDYCIEQANDMVAGIGDFASSHHTFRSSATSSPTSPNTGLGNSARKLNTRP